LVDRPAHPNSPRGHRDPHQNVNDRIPDHRASALAAYYAATSLLRNSYKSAFPFTPGFPPSTLKNYHSLTIP
jgi:hypothetical protein